MAGSADEGEPTEPRKRTPEFAALSTASPNAELLGVLDEVLLELEKRLLHYARMGPELLDMANEGLVLAARAGAPGPGAVIRAARHVCALSGIS